MDTRTFEIAVQAGSPTTVAALIVGATEPERAVYAKLTFRLLGRHHIDHMNSQYLVATLGTAPSAYEALRRVGRVIMVPELRDAVLAVLLDRRPSWLQELAEQGMAKDPSDFRSVVDALIDAGAIERPTSDAYLRGMTDGFYGRPDAAGIRKRLLADPANVDENVRRYLRSPGVGDRLYWSDYFQGYDPWHKTTQTPQIEGATWCAQIAQLIRERHVDGPAVIDICLGVLSGEPTPKDLVWFVRMHDAIGLTIDELARRADRYRRLLRAESSVLVAMGQAAIGKLLGAERISADQVLTASSVPLHRAEKKVVLAQLKLIERSLKIDPSLTAQAVDAIAVVLGHQRADLQAAALMLIDKYADASTRSELAAAGAADALAPTLLSQARAAGLIESGLEQPRPVLDPDEVRALVGSISALTRTEFGLDDAVARVLGGRVPEAVSTPPAFGPVAPPPIAGPDELIELFTRSIERPADAIDVERVMAGSVRFASLPLTTRQQLAEPVFQRARDLALAEANFDGYGEVGKYLASLLCSWATGWSMAYRSTAPTRLSTVFAVRIAESTRMIFAGHCVLLAEPTHLSGAVASDVLLERLELARARGHDLYPVDVDTAALRLPPALDNSFWTEARKIDEQVGERLHTRYGERSQPALTPRIGTPRRYWEFKETTPVVTAEIDQPVAAVGIAWAPLISLHDTLQRHPDLVNESGDSELPAAVTLWPLLAPWHHELIAAHLLRPLSRVNVPSTSSAATATQALDSPTGTFGPIAHLALAHALQGTLAETRTTAADVFQATAADGRLIPQWLADAFVALSRESMLKVRRIVETIRPTTSERIAGHRALAAINLALPDLIDLGSRDLHLFLELAAQLTVRFGDESTPAAVRDLAIRKGGSRLLVEARRMASVTSTGPERSTAAVEALRGLVSRAHTAEAWANSDRI